MIKVENIHFRYSTVRPKVFENFTLELANGNIIGLLGKNGTGKSTLLYLISGLLRPQKGKIRFFPDMNSYEATKHANITNASSEISNANEGIDTSLRTPETLSEIFIVPEEFDLPAISMEEYVKINIPFYPRFDHEIFQQNLAAFELPVEINLGQLSMGQKKKAFMAFALAAGTKVLLMDEPTNGLDIPSKGQFRRAVANSMRDDRTIIISTHQVSDVEMLIDHVVMIEGNELLINKSVGEICEKLRFEQRPYGADLTDALYVEPSIAGNAVIARGDGFQSSSINLELLFNALIKRPNLLQ